MKINALRFWLVAIGLLVFPVGARSQQRVAAEHSDQAETARLRSLATEALGIPVGKEAEFRAEANLIGLRSKEFLFSRRLDSETYFVQDLRREDPKTATYQGSDEEVLERMRRLFRVLAIPPEEIAAPKVLQERTRLAQADRGTGKLSLEEERAGKRWGSFSRRVEGLPVFSSRTVLALTADMRIRFLELHWPAIPPHVLAEAHRLAYKVKEGWHPPEMSGARVEAVEAGIVHSPAVSFVMDIYPVIRVVYAALEGRGKKAVRYFDRNGLDAPLPRVFAQILIEPQKKRPARPVEKKK